MSFLQGPPGLPGFAGTPGIPVSTPDVINSKKKNKARERNSNNTIQRDFKRQRMKVKRGKIKRQAGQQNHKENANRR